MRKLVFLVAGVLLTGCANMPQSKPDPRDPWEKFNRGMFAITDAVDKAIGKPVAKAYVKVMPRFVRTGVNNVFNNLNTLGTAVNDVLQGKMRQAGRDSTRFVLNSTVGLGGLFDPASSVGFELNDEDFGQTFGKWGMKPGPYLVIPFLGPSTVRDTFGKLVDQFTYPVYWLEDDSTRIIIRAVSLLDTRAELLDLDQQIDRSYDRYAFIRNAWLQRREFQVKDGDVEDTSLDLEEGMEEPPPEEQAVPEGTAPPQDAAPGATGSPPTQPAPAPAPAEPPPKDAPDAAPPP